MEADVLSFRSSKSKRSNLVSPSVKSVVYSQRNSRYATEDSRRSMSLKVTGKDKVETTRKLQTIDNLMTALASVKKMDKESYDNILTMTLNDKIMQNAINDYRETKLALNSVNFGEISSIEQLKEPSHQLTFEQILDAMQAMRVEDELER